VVGIADQQTRRRANLLPEQPHIPEIEPARNRSGWRAIIDRGQIKRTLAAVTFDLDGQSD
jgi:hypothetical protein